MSLHGIFGLVWVTLIIHVLAAFFASIETGEYFPASKSQKAVWFATIWLLPFIGIILIHRKMGVRWGSGSNSSGGDASVAGGGHDGHGGGYGCGDSGCGSGGDGHSG